MSNSHTPSTPIKCVMFLAVRLPVQRRRVRRGTVTEGRRLPRGRTRVHANLCVYFHY